MKNNNKYISQKFTLILFIGITLLGCSKELDEVKPKNGILQEQLSDTDLGKLRNGVYAQVEAGFFGFAFDFDVKSENFRGGPGFSLVDAANMAPSDNNLLTLWRRAYNPIADVNFLLETIEKSTVNNPLIQTYKGEALYFRALLYYQLVTRWGGVPLLTSRTFEVVQRSSEAEVWAQIIADLKAAEILIPDLSNKFFVSKQAVQALLSRVYLDNGDKQNAIGYADLVINSGRFNLTSDSSSFATNFVANTTSREVVFAFINNNTNNRKLYYQLVNDVDPTWNYSPNLNLFTNLYRDAPNRVGDKRRRAVFSNDNTRLIKFPNGKSGQQLVTTTNADATPVIVSRLSEMFLIKAEAQGPSVAAQTTLAPYLAARYTTPTAPGVIAALTEIEFQNLILDERNREFYGEGYRWFDIKRTKRLDLLPSLNGRNYLLYYPIPLLELDLAKYTQNPGYN
jgi:starch-binding outer membrane protein, SusD/RagB family